MSNGVGSVSYDQVANGHSVNGRAGQHSEERDHPGLRNGDRDNKEGEGNHSVHSQ